MDETGVLNLLREALWATALMAMPLLISALVVGLLVGLVQALTSIQEMTLTFVPKLAAMLVVMFLTLGFMTNICLALFDNQVIPIVAGG
ncbi:flagellar biosynthetic protein FliQ [Algimonas porphyrae]|uniref:Flagellar biosynthetic protein FliQ n=2 Tax=Algimonas porphyrae TaxID=1128113 RepID=A0ABQ5V1S1_9PROT|nr:flagellar biosynthetic protein FliQ [Algimonas porphyrae]GLQ21421.1 flagellar biosynthetic protein FliQ [Algimonas porphyrae]